LLLRQVGRQSYYLYVPRGFAPGGPVLVSVHGASRGAEAHAQAWTEIAERHNLVVIAPLFDTHNFPDYQRLNFKGSRADLALHQLLEEVGRLTGADARQFYLYGFSGGGQFAHRYALIHPERLARVVVGAPGWWTLPDDSLAYPLGVKKTAGVPADVKFQVAEMLRLPLAVIVGEQDTERDRSLRQEPRVDRLQGRHRLERARNWFEQARRVAEENGIASEFELHVIAGVGHSGTHPAIIARAAAFLFPAADVGQQ
jgi:poly(3-hydroxybutyrate) depolymerase